MGAPARDEGRAVRELDQIGVRCRKTFETLGEDALNGVHRLLHVIRSPIITSPLNAVAPIMRRIWQANRNLIRCWPHPSRRPHRP